MKNLDRILQGPWHLEDWDRIEEPFRANHYDGSAEPDRILQFSAQGPFIFTAPHALNHFRDGQVKLADRWTGSASLILATLLDSSAIVPVGPIQDWSSWSDRTDHFAVALDQAAATGSAFLDIHGMSDRHEVDLCVGLGPDPSFTMSRLAEFIQSSLSGYRVRINDPFTAVPVYTVTAHLQTEYRANALQLEITARLRNPASNFLEASQFINSLVQVLEDAHQQQLIG